MVGILKEMVQIYMDLLVFLVASVITIPLWGGLVNSVYGGHQQEI